MRSRITKRYRLTRIQKESKIIELYKAGYNVSEITKIVGCSATTATRFINKHIESTEPKEKSKRCQALALFDKGGKEKVLNAAIQLDIPVMESEEYFGEYLYAKGIDYFERLRDLKGESFPSFIDLCKALQIRNMTIREIDEAKQLVLEKQQLEQERNALLEQKQYLFDQIQALKNELGAKSSELNKVKNSYLQLEQAVEKMKDVQYDLSFIVKSLEKRKSDLEFIIKSKIESEIICRAIVESTRIQIKLILDSEWERNTLYLSALFEVLVKDTAGEFRNLLFPPSENYYDASLLIRFNNLINKTANQIKPEVMRAITPGIFDFAKQVVDNLNSIPVLPRQNFPNNQIPIYSPKNPQSSIVWEE